jgi:hypothetical protein
MCYGIVMVNLEADPERFDFGHGAVRAREAEVVAQSLAAIGVML